LPRLTREESQARTRARLLAAARCRFAQDGYAATSVDRIAEEAGFSKGAFYSNFSSKNAIFLEVLEQHGSESLDGLLASLADAADVAAAIDIVADWASETSRSGNWPLLVLEHARQEGEALRRQETILRAHWRRLGARLASFAPHLACDPVVLGALVHELTYAPAMSFVGRPRSGDLVRIVLRKMLAGDAEAAPRRRASRA
jgi:TetR/AcrR family transcriptional regulator, transcriptional repressor of aconitase